MKKKETRLELDFAIEGLRAYQHQHSVHIMCGTCCLQDRLSCISLVCDWSYKVSACFEDDVQRECLFQITSPSTNKLRPYLLYTNNMPQANISCCVLVAYENSSQTYAFIAKGVSGSIQQRNHEYSKLLKLFGSFRDQSYTLLAGTPIASD